MPLCVVGYGHLSLASVVAEHPNVDAELLYAAAEQYFPEAVSLLDISSLRFVRRPLTSATEPQVALVVLAGGFPSQCDGQTHT